MARDLSWLRRLVKSVALLLLLVSFSQFLPPLQHIAEPVNATASTALSVWNPVYGSWAVVDSTVSTGQFLIYKVNVTGNPVLNAFDITVRWNPALLNAVNLTQGGGIFDSPVFNILPGTEVSPDHVKFAGFLLGTTVVGNGTIFTFTLVLGIWLKSDPKLKYVDANANNVWDSSETVVYDTNNNNAYNAASEPTISGTPPSDLTLLKTDSLVRVHDDNGNGAWTSGEMVAYDANNDKQYETGETAINGTPPSRTDPGSTDIRIDTSSQLQNPPVTVTYRSLDGLFSNVPGTGDLMVVSVTVANEVVTLGDLIVLGVGVRNMGDIPMNNVNLDVLANNTLALGSQALGTMNANTMQTVTINWNTTGLTPGVYIINATATTTTTDAFPRDNSLSLESVRLVIHELALVSLTAPQFGRINHTVDIKVTVQNQGTISDKAVFFVKANNTLVKIEGTGDTTHAQQLNPGQNTTFTFTWDTRTLVDVVAAGTIPSVNTTISNDPRIKFVDSPRNSTAVRNETRVMYVDANTNNAWDMGEVIVYDTNGNRAYDAGELVIIGSTPTPGTSLKRDGKVRFFDKNANTLWDPGEIMVYDSNDDRKFFLGELVIVGGNGIWDAPIPGTDPGESIIYDGNNNGAFDAGDSVIAGATPALEQSLKTDTKILFVNANVDPLWNSGESVIYDSNEDNIYDRGIGRYSLEATVSPVAGERNLSNNVMDNKSIDIVPKFAHDLEITTSSLPSGATIIGVNQTVSITVKNNGVFDESFTASFLLRKSPLNQTLFQTQRQIAFNTSVAVQFTWVTRSLQGGNYNLTARVHLDSAEDEDTTTCVSKSQCSNEAYSLLPMGFRSPPVAVFDFTPSSPRSGAVVTFNATGSSDPEIAQGFSLQSFTWNFGDGSADQTCRVTQSQNCGAMTHVYASPGTFTVTLTVASCDFTGCTAVVSHSLSVGASPPQETPFILYAAVAAVVIAAVGGVLFFLSRRRKVRQQPSP